MEQLVIIDEEKVDYLPNGNLDEMMNRAVEKNPERREEIVIDYINMVIRNGKFTLGADERIRSFLISNFINPNEYSVNENGIQHVDYFSKPKIWRMV